MGWLDFQGARVQARRSARWRMKEPSMGVVRVGSRKAPWLLALLLALPGCGFEGDLPTPPSPPSPPVPPTQAGILLSLSASPIVAEPAAPWSAAWTLTVRETSGIGGDIQVVRATLVDSRWGGARADGARGGPGEGAARRQQPHRGREQPGDPHEPQLRLRSRHPRRQPQRDRRAERRPGQRRLRRRGRRGPGLHPQPAGAGRRAR
jgi:hypothetical protein